MEVFDAVARARGRGEAVVLVTCLDAEDDAPTQPGARVVVGRGGVLAGTLGDAYLDTAAAELAGDVLVGEASAQRRIGPREGPSCEVVAELHPPEPAVLVLGATPEGRAVADFARALGRRVVLCAPGGDAAVGKGVEVRADDPARYLLAAPPGETDALIVADPQARWVDEVLRVALASAAFFVGLVGDPHDAADVVRGLRRAGVPEHHVARLRCPCGLDLGGRSPEETGLSVIAEVLAVERGRRGGPRGIDWTVTPT